MKNKSKKSYNENQFILILIVLFGSLSLIIIILDYLNLGTKPIKTYQNVLIQLVFIFILLNFYKLKTNVNDRFLILKFGIGLIKKKVLIKDIDKIEEINLPWYYGIGMRIIKDGWLYNACWGQAIKLTIDKKTLIIGTKNRVELMKVLLEKKSKIE